VQALNTVVAPVKSALLVTPPTLSNKIIKNLGVQFCSLDASVLEDEALCRKGEIKDAVVRKKGKAPKPYKETKKSREEDGEEEDGPADH